MTGGLLWKQLWKAVSNALLRTPCPSFATRWWPKKRAWWDIWMWLCLEIRTTRLSSRLVSITILTTTCSPYSTTSTSRSLVSESNTDNPPPQWSIPEWWGLFFALFLLSFILYTNKSKKGGICNVWKLHDEK